MSVSIGINNVIKKYGDTTVIPDLSVQIKNGEFFLPSSAPPAAARPPCCA